MWINLTIYNQLQVFLSNLEAFHQNFWKPKSHTHFVALGDLLAQVIDLFGKYSNVEEAMQAATDAGVDFVSCSTGIDTQLQIIAALKSGIEDQERFVKTYTALQTLWTQISTEYKSFLKRAGNDLGTDKPVNEEEREVKIDREIPSKIQLIVAERNKESAKKVVNRAAKHETKKVVAASIFAGVGVITAANAAYDAFAAPIVDRWLETYSPVPVTSAHLKAAVASASALIAAGFFGTSIAKSYRQPVPQQPFTRVVVEPNDDPDAEEDASLVKAAGEGDHSAPLRRSSRTPK